MAAHAVSDATFVKTQRGGDKLLHEGFTYRVKHKLNQGMKSWSCDLKGSNCPGSVKTKPQGDGVVVTVVRPHSHLPVPDKVRGLEIKTKVIAQAVQQPTATAANVVAVEVGKMTREDLAFVPSNKKLKWSVWRSRKSSREKEAAVDDAVVEAEYKDLLTMILPEVDVQGESFLLYDSGPGEERIVIFATQHNLDILTVAKF